jgi:hypothetical protein
VRWTVRRGVAAGERETRRADTEHLVGVHARSGPTRVVRDGDLDAAVRHRLQPDCRSAVRQQPRRRDTGLPRGLGRHGDPDQEEPREGRQGAAVAGPPQDGRELVAVEVRAGRDAEQLVERLDRPAGPIERVPHPRRVSEQRGRVRKSCGHGPRR